MVMMDRHLGISTNTEPSDIAHGYDMIDSAPKSQIIHSWPKTINGQQHGHANPSVSIHTFEQALIETFKGRAEGVLTPYLFYDPPKNDSPISGVSPWGTDENILFGAQAWDHHISESTGSEKSSEYEFMDGDVTILEFALNNGLVDRLPKYMAVYSYGPGELIAVREKDCRLLSAIAERRDYHVCSYNSVDINPRYAIDAANEVHNRFNMAANAIQGDFMEGHLALGTRDGTSVVSLFGGPFANAPNIMGHMSSKQKAAEYLSKLTRQHGMGTQLIMTVDSQHDAKVLERNYKPTKAFEAFVLSAFPRAIQEGIIKDKDYDVFKHWRMKEVFDEKTSCVKLIAQCKKGHTISTDHGSFRFSKDHELTFILSNKWDRKDLTEILNAAGFDAGKFYELGNGSRMLVTARAVKEPDLSLALS